MPEDERLAFVTEVASSLNPSERRKLAEALRGLEAGAPKPATVFEPRKPAETPGMRPAVPGMRPAAPGMRPAAPMAAPVEPVPRPTSGTDQTVDKELRKLMATQRTSTSDIRKQLFSCLALGALAMAVIVAMAVGGKELFDWVMARF